MFNYPVTCWLLNIELFSFNSEAVRYIGKCHLQSKYTTVMCISLAMYVSGGQYTVVASWAIKTSLLSSLHKLPAIQQWKYILRTYFYNISYKDSHLLTMWLWLKSARNTDISGLKIKKESICYDIWVNLSGVLKKGVVMKGIS